MRPRIPRRPEDRILLRFAVFMLLALTAVWLSVHVIVSREASSPAPTAARTSVDAAMAALRAAGVGPAEARSEEVRRDAVRRLLAHDAGFAGRSAVRTVDVAVGVSLLALFLVGLRIAWRATRGVRKERLRLERRADEVQALLDREKETVRRLHEINQMKSDFVSTASHELRTPLTSILGMAATLKRPQVAENPQLRAEFLDRVEDQGRRLLRLIEQLLEAAGLEHRRYRLRLEAVPLRALVGEVVGGIPRASERVHVQVPETLPPIVTDRDKVARILRNLLDNALKYSPRDAEVVIGASVDASAVRLWVEDRGIGMTPEEAARAFDPFYQADSGATRHAFGVGLGLHLVKLLAEALGGRVGVHTEHGTGSRFTVTLPSGGARRGTAPAHALAG